VAFESPSGTASKSRSTPRCLLGRAKKNAEFAATFWLNCRVKHRSPFGKVREGYVFYKFGLWTFQSVVQKFVVGGGQTTL
jgi:hypothetical protein